MKFFFKNNKKILLSLLVLIVIIISTYTKIRSIYNDISIIIAIPSFLMSFVVLNVLDIRPENLDRYYERRKITDDDIEINRKEFIEYLDEKLTPINRNIDDVQSYIYMKNNKTPLNPQKVNSCKNNYKSIELYFHETKKCVEREVLSIIATKDELMGFDKINYQNVYMSSDDLLKLDRLLNKMSMDYFVEGDLSEGKLKELKELFTKDSGLYTKYFNISKEAYKKLGGETLE